MAFRFTGYRSVFAASSARPDSGRRTAASRIDQFFEPGSAVELAVDSAQLDESGCTVFEILGLE